jgi:hypothetical protein
LPHTRQVIEQVGAPIGTSMGGGPTRGGRFVFQKASSMASSVM